MRRLDQMQHFMHDNVFKQVPGLLHQLGIQPNAPALWLQLHMVFIRCRK